MSTTLISQADALLQESRNFVIEQETKSKTKDSMRVELEALAEELKMNGTTLEDMSQAAALLGNVADENTRKLLDRVTSVINKSLETLFKDDKRRIVITQSLYRKEYPHYIVELIAENGNKRTFKQSGTGLGQVISFLFTICLIDARKARQILVMDELLNGLHPSAKGIVKGIMETLSPRFQFIVVEYGVDFGKQYEVVKSDGIATVQPYQGEGYYRDLGVTAKKDND